MSVVFPIEEDPRFRLSTATDGQTEFAVPFPFQANVDIVVVRIVAGVETVLAEAEDYTLTGAGEPGGGTVTLVEPAEASHQILRYGRVVLDRVSSITQAGKYSSRATDQDFDRNVIEAQEVRRDLGRAFLVKFGASGGAIEIGDDNVLLMWRGGQLVAGPLWGDVIGTPGPGVVAGGTIHQVLRKASDADYDTEWADAAAGVSGTELVITTAGSATVGATVARVAVNLAAPGTVALTLGEVAGRDQLQLVIADVAGNADITVAAHAGETTAVSEILAGYSATLYPSTTLNGWYKG